MVLERWIAVEGNKYCVVISDETETLLAARAAGRVPVGLLGNSGADPVMANYLIESLDTADDRFLERVVRRELGLPWTIMQSDRILIREFEFADWKRIPAEPQDEPSDRVFYDEEKLAAYIRGQYGFCEYGVWAVVRQEDGVIVGKAGIVGVREEKSLIFMEIGYHIFASYRRKGYAMEACRLILDYIEEEFEARACAVTGEENVASRKLLEKLGFEVCGGTGGKILYLQPQPYQII